MRWWYGLAAGCAALAITGSAAAVDKRACSEEEVEGYLLGTGARPNCFLPLVVWMREEELGRRYWQKVAERQQLYQQQLEEMVARLGDASALPARPAAPYVDQYLSLSGDRPFRSCKVYPGAGVDCTGD